MSINTNQLKIDTKKIDDTEKVREARERLRKAGSILEPEGHDYLGSVGLHFYRDRLALDPKCTYITQPTFLAELPEHVMINAIVTLKERMMELYGHNAPKRRK